MVDANLQQPSGALRKDVSERSGLPADTFELYHGSKRLEGEAVLARWGVEKDSLIEVKTRGRGGMHGGEGGEGGADGGGGVKGGGGGTDSCLGGIGGVRRGMMFVTRIDFIEALPLDNSQSDLVEALGSSHAR